VAVEVETCTVTHRLRVRLGVVLGRPSFFFFDEFFSLVFNMAEHLANIFGTEKDRVNCPFYFKIGSWFAPRVVLSSSNCIVTHSCASPDNDRLVSTR